jgi:A/G-specific adenine glycosylase
LFAVQEPLPQAKPLIQQLATTLLGETRAGDMNSRAGDVKSRAGDVKSRAGDVKSRAGDVKSRAGDVKSRGGDVKSRAGDSAQALMDLGSSICTPKKPACALCPFSDDCAARVRGDQEIFPRKAAKKTGLLRRGAAFVVTRGDQLLVRTRPEKGLLGGMTEVPTSAWLAALDDLTALEQAPLLNGVLRWHRKAGAVTHVFTHFPLELVIYTASAFARARAPDGMRWVPIATLKDEALPNIMRKVIAHGLGDQRDGRPLQKAGALTMDRDGPRS